MDVDRLGEPLGVQALAIRRFLVRDFVGTMRVLRVMGYGQIELVSFPGIVGNIRGDFTPMERMRPSAIRGAIREAGLICNSCHFLGPEFEPDNWPRTIDWARGVGITTMVFLGAELPKQPTSDDVRKLAEELNGHGQRVRAAGMHMAIHTDAVLWKRLGDGTVADALLREVDPAHCQLQIDFASVVQAGADGAGLIARHARRIDSLHLRDARKPADPDAYLPALPLGEGEVDWAAVMRAAKAAGVRRYIVEMQLRPAFGMLDGHKTSIDLLRALDL